MATKKKLLQAAAGTAAASGGAGALNVEQVFSTYLYDGNGVGNSINNGLNLGDDTEERVLLNLSGDDSTDSGPNSLSPTFNNVSPTTGTKKFGTGSLRFNGSGTVTVTDPTLILGNSDFTIEFWLMVDSLVLKGIFNIGNPSDHTEYNVGLYVHASGALTAQYRSTPNTLGQFSTGTSSSTITANTWHHIAVVRYNNTLTLYLDGSSVGSDDITGTTVGWNQLELGTHWGTSGTDDYRFTGRIDDFRMSKKAVYTGNFTPPTSAHSTSYTSTTGEGGLVWIKARNDGSSHSLHHKTTHYMASNETVAETSATNSVSSFNSNGFSLGSYFQVNSVNGYEYVSWTWRKAPKFFDVIEWTGDGTDGRTISHNLDGTVGTIIARRTDSTGYWRTWHRSQTGKYANLYDAAAFNTDSATNGVFNNYAGSDTTFTVGINLNASGGTYVAYLFAHNDGDGDFGDGTQDIIKCGSYTGNGLADGPEINLGFEPQWLLIKNATESGSSSTNWIILDNMRGLTVDGGNDPFLRPNLGNAEASAFDCVDPSVTGFKVVSTSAAFNTNGQTFIYIAIRRGPMAVPEDATDVFKTVVPTANQADSPTPYWSSGFVVDMAIHRHNAGSSGISHLVFDRVRGDNNAVATALSDSESTVNGTAAYSSFISGLELDHSEGVHSTVGYGAGSGSEDILHMWQRRPNYFDVVAYTGNGTAGRTVSHNLGVAPEMMWVKNRDSAVDWLVYHKDVGAGYYGVLSGSGTFDPNNNAWNSTAPTATDFTLGIFSNVNGSGSDYIAYLFASLDGVSKVGSYTGTGAGGNQIDCGFSSGARFVLIKRSSGSQNWYVFDTERGIVAGNDPSLNLNDTSAEYSSFDYIDPYSSGFELASGNISTNASGETYIFYAIA